MSSARPYLCLSALQRVEEVRGAAALFKVHSLPSPYLPCVGFAVDENLLARGATTAPRKVPTRSTLEACLKELAGQEVLPALHYDLRTGDLRTGDLRTGDLRTGDLKACGLPERGKSASPGCSVRDFSASFSASIEPLLSFAASTLPHGSFVQLNGVCQVTLLSKVRAELPNHKLIYCLKPEHYLLDVRERVAHIREGAPHIDYLLIDSSAGRGLPFSIDHLREVITALSGLPQVPGIGVAGGHSAKNIASRIEELSKIAIPGQISYDIESGIRDLNDIVSLLLVKEFLSVVHQHLR